MDNIVAILIFSHEILFQNGFVSRFVCLRGHSINFTVARYFCPCLMASVMNNANETQHVYRAIAVGVQVLHLNELDDANGPWKNSFASLDDFVIFLESN